MPNNSNQQLQQELYALPIRLKQVAIIDNTLKLYSSKSLKKKYVKSLAKVGLTKPIKEKIEELVDKEIINPVWMNKGLLRLTTFKIFAPSGLKLTMGFFTPDLGKIYILIDNNIRLGYVSDNQLAFLTLHESMHLAAAKMKRQYLSHFKEEFDLFYSNLFKEIFSIPDKHKFDPSQIIDFMFRKFEMRSNFNFKSEKDGYKKVIYSCVRKHSTLKDDQFTVMVHKYLFLIESYFKNINYFLKIIKYHKDILVPIYNSYSKSFNRTHLKTLCIQELFFPSEVIAVKSESVPDARIYSAFKKI